MAAAYRLAVKHGVKNVVLVDERDPVTLTSDKGTQGYRNWWPGPDDTMLRFISRSIDLMEDIADETDNLFRLNRRGYLFATAQEPGLKNLRATAQKVSSFGMGDVREHSSVSTYAAANPEGYRDQPDGADLLLGDAARSAFPFLSPATRAALHVRRAGWMNAVALAAWMFKQAVGAGVTFVRGRVEGIDTTGGRVQHVRLDSGEVIETNRVVLSAGPKLHEAGRMLGIDLPLFHELHAKVTFADPRGVIPRSAPFTIWIDEIDVEGTMFPGGIHVRPVDGPRGSELYLIWTYHSEPCPPVWPPLYDASYGDTCLRGLVAMAPGMAPYLAAADRGVTDGGYYCKTSDNRPLIGPLGVEGAYVLGALSGTGIMSSQSAADLLALHLTGGALPDYATAFLPARYDDPSYAAKVAEWGRLTGQL